MKIRSPLLLPLLATALFAGCSAPPVEAVPQEALRALDAQFDDSYAWWGRVYDPASGGAYYGLSGKAARAAGETQFGPDIEATSKLVHVLDYEHLTDDPALGPFRAGIARYFQERQDPKSGFFREPEFLDKYSARNLNRSLGMSKNALESVGSAPLYPLPLDRDDQNDEVKTHYAHLATPQKFAAWLEKLPWDRRMWTAGSTILEQGAIADLEPARRAALLDVLVPFLATKQAPDGYYGRPDSKDSWESRLSGTYKVYSFLEKSGRPFAMAETLRDTVLKDLRTREYDNLIVLYNTANILTILNRNGAPLNEQQKVEVLEGATRIFGMFRAPDGGFTTLRNRPTPGEGGRTFGKNVVEANTNATGLAHKTRELLYELAAGQEEAPVHPRAVDLLRALSAPFAAAEPARATQAP